MKTTNSSSVKKYYIADIENQKALIEHYEDTENWSARRAAKDILDEMYANLVPEEGMVGTVHYYTDSCSGYVGKVISENKVIFIENGIYDAVRMFSRRKNGRWIEVGSGIRDGLRLSLGYAHDYRCEEI